VAQAGLDAFASLAEASVEGAVPAGSIAPTSASIRVVRGPLPPQSGGAPAGGLQETVAGRVAESGPRARPSGRPRSADPRRRLAIGVAALLVALVGGAIGLPSATIRIAPAAVGVGPIAYDLSLPAADTERGSFSEVRDGTPTGELVELVPATGVVTFYNWNTVAVAVPGGTRVSVQGGIAFATDQLLIVPRGRFSGPSEASVAVTAVDGGESGNVEASSIDTIEDNSVRSFLAGYPDNPNRLVSNDEATAGGSQIPHTVVTQEDVDAVVTELRTALLADLADRLAEHPERTYVWPSSTEEASVEIPESLVGSEDLAQFSLVGRLAFARAWVLRADLEADAVDRLLADEGATPAGTTIAQDRIQVEIGRVTPNGGSVEAQVTVRAIATRLVDAEVVRELAAGLTAAEAEDALGSLGEVQVELWPGWVDRVPSLGLRVTVETVVPDSSASPSAAP